jgi:hypothetical protein
MIKRISASLSELACAIREQTALLKWLGSHLECATKQDLKEMEKRIMAVLDDLTAEVEETKTGIDSAIVLLNGLSQLIKDAGNDPVKLKALTDQLDAKNKELAEAVVANTPSEPPPA